MLFWKMLLRPYQPIAEAFEASVWLVRILQFYFQIMFIDLQYCCFKRCSVGHLIVVFKMVMVLVIIISIGDYGFGGNNSLTDGIGLPCIYRANLKWFKMVMVLKITILIGDQLTDGMGLPCIRQVRWASLFSPECTRSVSSSISGGSGGCLLLTMLNQGADY